MPALSLRSIASRSCDAAPNELCSFGLIVTTSQRLRQLPQLPVDVLPFAHAQEVQELGLAEPPERTRRKLPLLLLEVVPQVEERKKIAGRVGEPSVELVGGAAPFDRTLARILDGQPGDDRHHFATRPVALRLDHHAGEARVDRQLRQLASDPGQDGVAALRRHDRVQFGEQVEPVLDAARVRRRQEREGGDVTQTERDHLQDDGGEVRAQDLGFRELRALLEILLGVQADGDAVAGAPRAPGALVRRRLRDGFDRKALDLGAHAVAADAGGSGIHHVFDPGNREAGLGDVGGQHDATPHPGHLRRLEDAVLLGARQAPVEREDLGEREVASADGVRSIPDLVLAGEEHQHVAVGLAAQFVEGVVDALQVISIARLDGLAVFVLLDLADQGAVAHLDRERAAGDLDHRRGRAIRRGEMPRETLGVDRRRGDDHLQVGAFRQQLPQVADQEIDVQAALVCFVDDDRVVLAQHAIAMDLVEQDAVGHQLDARGRPDPVGEAHLVADEAPDILAQLFGDALGDRAGGDAAGLGVTDALPTQFEADLRQLGGLARAGLTGHDDDLVVADGARDHLPLLADRKLGRKVKAGGGDRGRHEPSILFAGKAACRGRGNCCAGRAGVAFIHTPRATRVDGDMRI